jgi:hypothetical protein
MSCMVHLLLNPHPPICTPSSSNLSSHFPFLTPPSYPPSLTSPSQPPFPPPPLPCFPWSPTSFPPGHSNSLFPPKNPYPIPSHRSHSTVHLTIMGASLSPPPLTPPPLVPPRSLSTLVLHPFFYML